MRPVTGPASATRPGERNAQRIRVWLFRAIRPALKLALASIESTDIAAADMEQRVAILIWLAVAASLCVLVSCASRVRLKRPPHDTAAGTTDPFNAFISGRYFSGLDALRAFSVVAVIWTHVSGEHTIHLLTQGNRGVDLFFAISGFLITTLLLREHRRKGRISLRDFYIRRGLRIFPLYYAVLLLYCVLVFATLRGTAKGAEFWANLPAFATYTSNWFVTLGNSADHGVTFYFAWSLATEEQFYLFWPSLLVLLLLRTRSDLALVLAAMGLLGLQIGASAVGSGTLASTIVASLSPAILLGVAFAVLLNRRAVFELVFPVLGNRITAVATAVLLLVSLQVGAPLLLSRLLMALLVASVCVREDTYLHPVLTWRPAAFVGVISYGIYLMHMLAANAVRKVLGHEFGPDVFICTTLLVVFMAYVSFRFFESPLLALKHRFGSQSDDVRQTSVVGQPANI
jgi:peptidoglycan/LPS O-acetylase OafA/YrhL